MEGRRSERLRATLRLVAELLNGKAHDRHSAAKLLGMQHAGAYRQLQAIATALPGMRWQDGSVRTLEFDRSWLANRPPFPVAVAACFGAALANLFEGANQEAGMRTAAEYVFGKTRHYKVFRDIERKFTFVRRGGESALPENAGLLDDLINAVLRCREVSFDYTSFDGTTTPHRVRPLSLSVYDHQLYLLAAPTGRQARAYRFSRIANVDEHNRFEYPPKSEYDPAQLFRDSFGVFVRPDYPVEDIELRLSKRWRAFSSSHRWHPSQRVAVLPNGDVSLHLRVKCCPEIEAWILGFADEAEVLQPASLRRRVAARLGRAAKTYQRQGRRPRRY